MAIKTVYICDMCKTHHNSKKSMDKCFKKCIELTQNQKLELDIKNTLRDSFVNNISSIDDVKLQIINVFKELGLEINFKTFNINFSKHIRNTHNCPKSGQTNWHSVRSLPTGYPGFNGHIDFSASGDLKSEYVIEKNKNYWYISDLLRYYCKNLHMCSGGGGTKDYSCSFIMFFDDFPKLKDLYSKYELIIPKQEKYVIDCDKSKDLYHNALNDFIGNNEEYNTIKNKINELEKQIQNFTYILIDVRKNLNLKFQSENIMKYIIPKIEEYDEFQSICKKLGDEYATAYNPILFGTTI
jgi:hypothetical protein